MDIQRRALCEVVFRRAPRLIVVSAPAGYGKSTFVRQLLARIDNWAVSDCVGVANETDLARAVLVALAAARPALADSIAQAQLGASGEPRDWEAIACGFWAGDGPSTFVFENAEALTRSPSASALFERLIRGGQRVVIVCSRDVVPVPYGRGFDPTNVVTFGINDLRFSIDEIRAAVPELTSSQQGIIDKISRGWPIVVALLGRAAQEKPFADAVAGLGAVVHSELLVYLASELIGDLRESERELAFILAALPDIHYHDIFRAWPSVTSDDIERLALRLPLSRDSDGALRLHPMLIQLLREHAGTRIPQIVKQAAEAARGAGDETRAAELYLSINDEFAAASVLRNVGTFTMATPTPRLAAVISRFDEKTLLTFPALWCCALMHRGYAIPPYEWLRSAQAIWDALPVSVEPELRASVFSSLINGHTNIGLCARARELLDEYRATLGDSDPCGVAELWSACLDSHDGCYDRIPQYTKTLTPLLDASRLTHALYLYDVISAIPRSRGEWDRDAEVLRRSRELINSVPLMSISLLPLVESAFARWLAGDDEQCDGFVAELESLVTIANERGHRFFIACTRGGADTVPYGYEKMKARAQGLLIASARAETRDAARRLASDALRAADACNRRYIRILARCALALLDDARRDVLLGEAASLSLGLDSEPMREAVIALLEHRPDAGMLTPFVQRYKALCGAIEVRVLRGEVYIEGKSVALARSELALLIALAQAPRSFSICELGDLLFPDLDADSAGNRLHVYIHRLRQRLGRDAVLADQRGYRLGSAVEVDLWQLRSFAVETRAGARNSHAEPPFSLPEPLSLPELEALAFRLRLPEQLTGVLREGLSFALTLRLDQANR